MNIKHIVNKQKEFFETGRTKDYTFRMNALTRLERAIKINENRIHQALGIDLHKSAFESYMTETGMTISELTYVKKHVKQWASYKKIVSPLAQFHSKSYVISEPYGVVLIMSPWNYPFMLSMEPLIGAIAAGNCCILKPSAYAPAVSAVIKSIIEELFPANYIAVIEGGRQENEQLLEQQFDYIFFTGGREVGRFVMKKAAEHITPVTLELGGKSPCIVDVTADLNTAAKRLVFGKFLNSGQTCVAPDYLLVQSDVEKEFIFYIKKWICRMLGKEPLKNDNYPKMINEKHYERVLNLIREEQIAAGGYGNRKTLKIAPTVLVNCKETSPVMQEEIFGPVLPILSYKRIEDAVRFIKKREKPLALYLFTRDKATSKKVLRDVSFGGGCINDTIVHLATSRMGFGGVGGSGMGSYHGKDSFDTFSHKKSIVNKYNWIDLPIRYQPYNKIKFKLLRVFLK